jgi:hypothetical protein
VKPVAKRRSPAKASAATANGKIKNSGFKPASKAAPVVLSSDSDSDDSDELENTPPKKKRRRETIRDDEEEAEDQERDEDVSEEEAAPARKEPRKVQVDDEPAIPQKLLTRLLYEGFEDKNMKIGKEAMTVVGKYMETFVREALARAVYEREEAEAEIGKGTGDGFLQVSARTSLGFGGGTLILMSYRLKIWRSWRRSFCLISDRRISF